MQISHRQGLEVPWGLVDHHVPLDLGFQTLHRQGIHHQHPRTFTQSSCGQNQELALVLVFGRRLIQKENKPLHWVTETNRQANRWMNRNRHANRSKTHKRLKKCFLIRRNRTKRENFRDKPLFQATYNNTTAVSYTHLTLPTRRTV